MLGLSVRVLPLLRREVQMSDVRVEGLNLRLNRDKDGHGNWEDVGKLPVPANTGATSTPPAAGEPAPEASVAAEKPAQPIRLDIDSLTVNNARVEYTDERTGKQLQRRKHSVEHRRGSRLRPIFRSSSPLSWHQPAGTASAHRAQWRGALSTRAAALSSSKT